MSFARDLAKGGISPTIREGSFATLDEPSPTVGLCHVVTRKSSAARSTDEPVDTREPDETISLRSNRARAIANRLEAVLPTNRTAH